MSSNISGLNPTGSILFGRARPRATTMSVANQDHKRFFWMAVLIVNIAFFAVKFEVLSTFNYQFNSAEVELEGAEQGSRVITRGLSIVSLGFFGAWAFFKAMKISPPMNSILFPLSYAFLAWTIISILWSDEPKTTFLRWIQMASCIIGGIGIGRRMRTGDLTKLTLYVSAAYMLFGAFGEMAFGAFRPWASGYRFAGGVHPNAQGQYCSMACLAAIALIGEWSVKRCMMFFVPGFILLVLTGSRTSCAATLLSMLLYWSFFMQAHTLAGEHRPGVPRVLRHADEAVGRFRRRWWRRSGRRLAFDVRRRRCHLVHGATSAVARADVVRLGEARHRLRLWRLLHRSAQRRTLRSRLLDSAECAQCLSRSHSTNRFRGLLFDGVGFVLRVVSQLGLFPPHT